MQSPPYVDLALQSTTTNSTPLIKPLPYSREFCRLCLP